MLSYSMQAGVPGVGMRRTLAVGWGVHHAGDAHAVWRADSDNAEREQAADGGDQALVGADADDGGAQVALLWQRVVAALRVRQWVGPVGLEACPVRPGGF